MATAKSRIIHKHFRLDSIKLKRAQKVLDALKSIKGATSVNSSGTALTPEISIIFERETD